MIVGLREGDASESHEPQRGKTPCTGNGPHRSTCPREMAPASHDAYREPALHFTAVSMT